ncbi:hypothetical protein PLUTE_a5114 [Pseudoalteromonas luteoviolacea DSM 6061]|nr:hypothetical protein [Pseudoalteromonas luteoviolacea DSM 6061]
MQTLEELNSVAFDLGMDLQVSFVRYDKVGYKLNRLKEKPANTS